MSVHDPAVTLRQLAEACDRALDLRRSTTWDEFRNDWRRQLLAERLLEIMGEAVKRLPESLRTRHPNIPWRDIAGTRDQIVHGYDTSITRSSGACSTPRRPASRPPWPPCSGRTSPTLPLRSPRGRRSHEPRPWVIGHPLRDQRGAAYGQTEAPLGSCARWMSNGARDVASTRGPPSSSRFPAPTHLNCGGVRRHR